MGKAYKFGHDIDTDIIIPARYLNDITPEHLAAHCMEDAGTGFARDVKPGDILVAGKNFGCGSSREHAPLAIMGCGISCVIAKSFSRLFYRNAINIGLPVMIANVSPFVTEGDAVSVDCLSGQVTLIRADKEIRGEPLPPFMLEILRCGGLIGYLEKHLQGQQ